MIITMNWIHIANIKIVIKYTFKEAINSKIYIYMDIQINNHSDGSLGNKIGNLYASKLV